MSNQEIDIDLLISKLLEIPNEDILNSILNLSQSQSREHEELNEDDDGESISKYNTLNGHHRNRFLS